MSFFGIMSPWDMTFYLIIYAGHSGLYFKVQWFYFISWRLFDGWMSYFVIIRHYDMTFDRKINVGESDMYFMVQWFCSLSGGLLDGWTWYFGIASQCDITFDLILTRTTLFRKDEKVIDSYIYFIHIGLEKCTGAIYFCSDWTISRNALKF